MEHSNPNHPAPNTFASMWKMVRAMKKAGWTYVSSNDKGIEFCSSCEQPIGQSETTDCPECIAHNVMNR